MNHFHKLRIRFSALVGLLLVAQCCCCIIPLRMRGELEAPGLVRSGEASIHALSRDATFSRERAVFSELQDYPAVYWQDATLER